MILTEHATVYNFMVKDFHTYFVSNLGIWTHNSCVDLNAVAKYIKKHGKLPDNYITKDEATALGWDPRRGNLSQVAPGKSIGGDIYNNYDGVVPPAKGRLWYEADVEYQGGYRKQARLLYSNDGLFYLWNHGTKAIPITIK